ncbi:matrixin domain protein [Bacteriovorax sp. BSW11_IV]|uniref:matrixin family metalloprotease n=1 Tax=Bacteriovorax sp. BSW11_IV TaxID=1353529 RepID=UPI00038A3C69|nr:matrixin family metalloprotease [Bacteriovorax sp. BSW11_IV]EQC50277.1 matrixin domain protein [Bacteriovorax sp. BSW11_IV]
MRILIITSFCFLCFDVWAWTLNSSSRRGFPTNEVVVEVATSSCSNTSFSSNELKDLVEEAVSQFWNAVSTSGLKLTVEQRSIDVSGATTLGTIADLASHNKILVGCNSGISSFSDGSILGVGGLQCTSSYCQGAVALNDAAGTNLASVSHSVVLATFAHELGHALGLGHSSVEFALMFYSVGGKDQEFLAEDDMKGISWLYPLDKKLAGLGGSCATIDDGTNSWRISKTFFLLLFFIFSFYLIKIRNDLKKL